MLFFVSVFSTQLSRHSFDQQNIDAALLAPNSTYWLGTDDLGRDIFARLLRGARISLAVGFITAFISLCLGLFWGGLAGWKGGVVDRVIMRGVDILYAIPNMVILILVSVSFNTMFEFDNIELQGLLGILLALGLTSWGGLARVVRGQILQIKKMPYIEAARAVGASDLRQLRHHVLPNLWGPLIVMLSFQIPSNILAESFLSFIGLGLQPPYSSWGVMASEGWRTLQIFPHLMLYPGLILFITVLVLNLLGDALRSQLQK